MLWTARAVGLFALSRALTGARVRILCYHGGSIGDAHIYNPKLFCSPELLEARMQWLQTHGFDLVTLEQAATASRRGKPSRRLTTTVTFDDGWHTTANQLVPVLARRDIPSTLYLCTSHFLESWAVGAVTVRYLLWKSGLRQANILGMGPGIDGCYDIATKAARNSAADRIVKAIKLSPPEREARHALFETLAACLKIASDDLGLATRRFEYVNRAELQAIATQGCAIELHGHVHRYPAGNVAAFKEDLRRCSEIIEAEGLPKPRHYCYPSGNFDRAASGALLDMGIDTATTCVPGLVKQDTLVDRHYLPRFLDGADVSMLEFQSEMSGFSDLLRRLRRAGRSAWEAAELQESRSQASAV